jgi:hypothetical protein
MHKPLTLHISLAGLLLAVFAFQFEVLQPIEKALLGEGQIHFVDWLFLPHGLKVIFVVLLGASVLWGVFPVQLAAMWFFLDTSFETALVYAIVATGGLWVSLALLNFPAGRSLNKGFASGEDTSFRLFRAVILIALITSLITALGMSAWYASIDRVWVFPFKFIIGDMLGALVNLTILVAVRKPILNTVKFK